MRRTVLTFLAVIIAAASLSAKSTGIKYASAYGFRPGNSAEKNAVALQKALDGGGTVVVDIPGTYALCNTIYIDSNTTLEFGANVFISKERNSRGKASTYTFVNRGAFTRTFDENITIRNLHLKANEIMMGDDVEWVFGLNGVLAFYCIRNLVIEGFNVFDGPHDTYMIHVTDFEDIKILNTHIEGWKDAIHLQKGRKFLIRDCQFKTFDDPLAFNAHAYVTTQPVIGWLEDGLVENCYDLADPDRRTTGFFCRILGGSWTDWKEGMELQSGDIVVSEGRLYRVYEPYDAKKFVSTCRPTFESGIQTLPDGIRWLMFQDHDILYSCGVRNVHFKDIYLQKPRNIAFQIHFDKDEFSRSYYPDAEPPMQENIIFENINMQAPIPILIKAKTPVNNFKLVNSMLTDSRIWLIDMGEGLHYEPTHVLLSGVTFKGSGRQIIVDNDLTRPVDVRIVGSIVEGENFDPVIVNTKVLGCDIDVKQEVVETPGFHD